MQSTDYFKTCHSHTSIEYELHTNIFLFISVWWEYFGGGGCPSLSSACSELCKHPNVLFLIKIRSPKITLINMCKSEKNLMNYEDIVISRSIQNYCFYVKK